MISILKVVLIDDNVNTLNSLRLTVNWNELGYEIAGVAQNGETGSKLIERVRPDVVFTDIQMPGVNGLDMIERMQEYLTNSRVIVITAYDKFQYATQAIRLSVMDYVLKPIDNEELKKTLLRAKKSLEQQSEQKEQIKQMDLFHRRAQLLSILTSYGSKVEPGCFERFMKKKVNRYFLIVGRSRAVISRPSLERLEFEHYPEIVEIVSVLIDGELVLFCGLYRPVETWKITAQTIANIMMEHIEEICIGISELHQEEQELKKAYHEGRKALLESSVLERSTRTRFFSSEAYSHNAGHTKFIKLEETSAMLAAKFNQLGETETWNIMSQYYEGNLRQLRILLMMYCTGIMRNHLKNDRWTAEVDACVFELDQISSEEEAKNWFFRFYNLIRKQSGMVSSVSILICNIVDYIRANAAGGLRLEDVSNQFNISPNYLSTLIRKETGITYQQHLLLAKVAIAKQLLDDTRMRVEDIAYSIGYENYISFYNIFKRIEGITPSEYRFRSRHGGI